MEVLSDFSERESMVGGGIGGFHSEVMKDDAEMLKDLQHFLLSPLKWKGRKEGGGWLLGSLLIAFKKPEDEVVM